MNEYSNNYPNDWKQLFRTYQNISKIADIGSDHAYLPCYAVKTGIASSAIAGEVVKGPFVSALKQVKLNARKTRWMSDWEMVWMCSGREKSIVSPLLEWVGR